MPRRAGQPADRRRARRRRRRRARASRRAPPRCGARRSAAIARERLERRAHRVGVGVVGVVDDGDAVGALGDLHPPAAGRAGRPSAAATASTVRPSSSATAATARALPTWCSPCRPSRTGGLAPRGVTRVNDGRPASSSRTSVARTSASRLAHEHDPGVGAAAMARHQRVVGVEDRDAGPAGRAATSSDLASPIASREPNSPTWAVPTLSTTPTARRRDAGEVVDVTDAAGAHLDDQVAGLGVTGRP